jgi:hypothetical protein
LINLTIDFLNKVIDGKIEIYNKKAYLSDKTEDEVKEEFIERCKSDVEFKVISLILEHTLLIYRYIYNELIVEYKLRVINQGNFYVYGKKEDININLEFYYFTCEEKEIIDQIVSETNRIITGNTSLSYYVLYLLPFNNGDYYKIGITNQKDLFRIKYLDDVYDINFDKAAIFYGFKRDILLTERYLKQYIPKIYDNPYDGMNGFSEVREIEHFDKTMEKCSNQFAIDFGFLKYKLKDLDIPEWKNSIKQRPKRKEEIQIDIPDIYLEVIDMPDNDSYF